MMLDYIFKPKKITFDRTYKEAFNLERASINIKRLDIIAKLASIYYFIFILFDIFVFIPKHQSVANYRIMLLGHCVMLFAIIIYFAVMILSYKQVISKNIDKLITSVYFYFILLWSAGMSINSQLLDIGITAYIIAVFLISAFAILSPKESGFMLFSTYLFMIICFYFIDNNLKTLVSNITSATVMLIFSYILSIINYRIYFSNFINRETVKRKSDELKLANSNLQAEIDKVNKLNAEKDILLVKAKEYEVLRTNFFSNISHELRTPINVLLCAQQMLPADPENKNLQYSNMIRQNCYRLLKLTNNLIDINKIDASYFEINLVNCDIVKVVEDIFISVKEYVKSKDLTFIFDTDVEEKIIACDPEKIERIMLNLISNAIKFTNAGGGIFVNINSRSQNIEISVKDTGIGIPKEKQDLIFERFVQLDNSLSRSCEGSGIGLSIVEKLVSMHNGHIKLVSQEGRGSEFIISLPDTVLEEKTAAENSILKKHIAQTDKSQLINIELSDINLD